MKKSNKFLLLETILLIIIMSLGKSFIISVVSILLHEIGHVIVGYFYGCKLYKFNISITGANVELDDVGDLKDFQRLNLYLIGPIINLCIFLICYCFSEIIESDLLLLIGRINLGLFIFNMIPAYPLDGSRILEIMLSKSFTYRIAKKIMCIISYTLSGILILVFAYGITIHKINVSLILISGLIIYSAYVEKKSTIYIMMSNIFKKIRLIENYEYIENRSISVSYNNTLLNMLRIIDKNKYNIFYILDDELKVIEILYENEIIEGLKLYGNISLKEYLDIKCIDNIEKKD